MGTIIKETAIIFDNNDAVERNKKEQEYLDYIKDHISNVIKAFNIYFIPLLEINNISDMLGDEVIKTAINNVASIINTHDASKFSDSEFDGYRCKWYPTTLEANADEHYKESVDDRYEECWEHHYKTNAHHPKYWYDFEKGVSKDMSLEAIIEMICDWEAMSMHFGTSTLAWYEDKVDEEKKVLSDESKKIVEEFLYNIIRETR